MPLEILPAAREIFLICAINDKSSTSESNIRFSENEFFLLRHSDSYMSLPTNRLWLPWPIGYVFCLRISFHSPFKFEFSQGPSISCEEAIKRPYGKSVVLLRCHLKPEIMYEGAPEVFLHP